MNELSLVIVHAPSEVYDHCTGQIIHSRPYSRGMIFTVALPAFAVYHNQIVQSGGVVYRDFFDVELTAV